MAAPSSRGREHAIDVALIALVTLTWGATSFPRSAYVWLFDWSASALACAAVWAVALLAWAARSVGRATARGSPPQGLPECPKSRWRAWRVPAWAAAAGVPVLFGWPAAVRFQLSHRALAEHASSCLAEPKPHLLKPARRIGLYRVHWARPGPDGTVQYMIDGVGGLMGWGGFLFSPHRVPHRQATALGEGWYLWLDST